MEDSGSPRQSLRYPVHQEEILRSGEHVGSLVVRVIDRNLDRGQDVRDPLDLVNDDRWTVAGQKAVGIVTGEPARLGVLQVDVIEVGKGRARQGRLPRLARAGQGDHRIVAGVAHQQRTKRTGKHVFDKFTISSSIWQYGVTGARVARGGPGDGVAAGGGVGYDRDMGTEQGSGALDAAAIEAALGELSGWRRDGDSLLREYRFGSFKEAVSFIVRIAFAAEAANHHPEIGNVYSTVRIRLSTHDAGNQVTRRDLDLAQEIEAIAWV